MPVPTDGSRRNELARGGAPCLVLLSAKGKSEIVVRERQKVRQWAAAGAVLLGLSSSTPSWGQIPGQLTQLPGFDGCIADVGGATCTDGRALDGPSNSASVAMSPDGKHLYIASADSDAVAVLRRTKSIGVLAQDPTIDGCVSETGNNGCSDGTALDSPRGVAVSPDGKHVYVVSDASNAVAAFTRNKSTGALTQLAGLDRCISDSGSGGDCADGKALVGAWAVTVSPDGKHIYVASFVSTAVAVFARDKNTGALAQLAGTDGCISNDGSGGTCTDGHALLNPYSVAVSKDGKHVYVTSISSDAIAAFARDKGTGVLTQLANPADCTSEDGSGGTCVDGKALDGAVALAISKDGKHVYVGATTSGAVAVFAREK